MQTGYLEWLRPRQQEKKQNKAKTTAIANKSSRKGQRETFRRDGQIPPITADC